MSISIKGSRTARIMPLSISYSSLSNHLQTIQSLANVSSKSSLRQSLHRHFHSDSRQLLPITLRPTTFPTRSTLLRLNIRHESCNFPHAILKRFDSFPVILFVEQVCCSFAGIFAEPAWGFGDGFGVNYGVDECSVCGNLVVAFAVDDLAVGNDASSDSVDGVGVRDVIFVYDVVFFD
jgi:hypothetical protein